MCKARNNPGSPVWPGSLVPVKIPPIIQGTDLLVQFDMSGISFVPGWRRPILLN